jgi:hypothetical protein
VPGPPSSAERIYEQVVAAGPSGLNIRELPALLRLSQRTIWRLIAQLETEGRIDRFAPGYARVRREDADQKLHRLPSGEADELLRLIRTNGLPAYLSGLDVLAPYAHHFLFEFPHLVVALKGTGRDVAHTFAAVGFIVLQDQQQPAAAPLSQVVVLRELSRWTRYPTRNHLATPELAWLDLYREVRRRTLELPPRELGRILEQLLRRAGTDKRLRALAREHFKGEIDSILDDQPRGTFAAAVTHGLRA